MKRNENAWSEIKRALHEISLKKKKAMMKDEVELK